MGTNTTVDDILAAVFEPEQRSCSDQLDHLIEQNHMKGGHPAGFLYGGVFHTKLPTASQKQVPKKIIAKPLRDEARSYMQELRDLQTGMNSAKHGLLFILRECGSDQDLRDVLTDSVAKFIPSLRPLPRQRPAGWLFEARPLQKLRFEGVMQLLEYHISNRLL